MIALPESKACSLLLEHALIISSGLHHGLTFKPASRMENDEARCNSRLPAMVQALELLGRSASADPYCSRLTAANSRQRFSLEQNPPHLSFGGVIDVSNAGNRLLIALPPRSLKEIMPELGRISCKHDDCLTDIDEPLDRIYFPDTCVISMQAVYADGSTIEMATIGKEGCAGIQAAFGAKTSSARFLVQIPGLVTQMRRAAFVRAMTTVPSFRSLMHAYVPAFMDQVLVSGACNGRHSIKQRLARWLLLMRDRFDDDILPITQDILAAMLGVLRPTITVAARELERDGLITRGRRQITIIDRKGLLQASCECYPMIRARFASYLPKTYP
jgi:CRP-like cAMP-binding protein